MSYTNKLSWCRILACVLGAALLGAPGYAEVGPSSAGGNISNTSAFHLDEIVVTGYRTEDPLSIVTDPRAPRQPIPAADGGGYLKNIPGFSVTRKSGVAGDPLFRGMGGSRLVMCTNCSKMSGACPGRMDPTTSYAFPETYSRIIIHKGPESVRYGASVAGSVIFERKTPRFAKEGIRGNLSMVGGSFHRFDQLVDVAAGKEEGYIRFIETRNYSRNYKDGDGREVHSGYGRNALSFIAGYTPDKDTRFEISYDRGRGWAKFASGDNDGVRFDRDSYILKWEKAHISPLIEKISVNFNHDTIDHLMDNYTLKGKDDGAAMNPVRRQYNGGVIADIKWSEREKGAIGFDFAKQKHTGRMKMMGEPFEEAARDMTIDNIGLFLEYNVAISGKEQLKSGLRWDHIKNQYEKRYNRLPGTVENNAFSGFLRYEVQNTDKPLTFYVGVGHAERAADYWESYNSWTANSKWSAPFRPVLPGESQPAKEKNNQVDIGWIYRGEKTKASLSLYHAWVSDFILYSPETWKHWVNVNARLYGGEADITRRITPHLTIGASFSMTRGTDLTHKSYLPQLAPMEGNITAKYRKGKGEWNVVWRLVGAQTHYHKGYGNVIGTDTGPTAGFGIFSLSAAYRPTKNLSISLGIDNVFNKTYEEFVSKAQVPNALVGAQAETHIHEPGRTLWCKTNYRF